MSDRTPMTVAQFFDIHGASWDVHGVCHVDSNGYTVNDWWWHASFKNYAGRERGCLVGFWGKGDTPEAAMANYIVSWNSFRSMRDPIGAILDPAPLLFVNAEAMYRHECAEDDDA